MKKTIKRAKAVKSVKRVKREGSHKEPKFLEKTKTAVYEKDLVDVILPGVDMLITAKKNRDWGGAKITDTDKYEDYKYMAQLYNRLVRAAKRLTDDKSIVEIPVMGIKMWSDNMKK